MLTGVDYDGDLRLPTPRFGRLAYWKTRTNTNDGALVRGIIAGDEYELGRIGTLDGTAIDIGAHIGIITIALAVDHPGLRVIAVEPVPENVVGLRLNVELNGLGDRVTVVEAAAAAPGRKTAKLLWNYRSAANTDLPYIVDSRYIANIFGPADSDGDTHTVPAVSLDDLMDGLDEVALLKVDCEGCEWQFLRSKRVKDVRLIIGEFHNAGGLASLEKLIGSTHAIEQIGGAADVGLFRAVRR